MGLVDFRDFGDFYSYGGPCRDNFRTGGLKRNGKITQERDQLQVVFTKSRGKKGEDKD